MLWPLTIPYEINGHTISDINEELPKNLEDVIHDPIDVRSELDFVVRPLTV
jgi:hypothetical protein